MKNKIFTCAILVLGILALTDFTNKNLSYGYTATCCITGHAYYASNFANATNCQVLITFSSNRICETTTDANGNFSCCGIPDSDVDYTVEIRCINDCNGYKFSAVCGTPYNIGVNCQ
ncbi:MAG: hypothetical protein SGI89_08105 [bacterium]|nr:hypothetical protein [bacterium]